MGDELAVTCLTSPNPKHRDFATVLWASLCLVTSGTAFAQTHNGVELVRAELIAAVDAVVPGETFKAGLLLKIAPGWHTYWQNPGDAGLPPKIAWNLPEGFHVSEFKWPYPKRIDDGAEMVTYAYENEVLLIFEVTAPPGIESKEVTLAGEASWLVCAEICIPGKAPVELTLPVHDTAKPVDADLFAKFEERLPQPLPEQVRTALRRIGENSIRLEVRVDEGWSVLNFFPLPTGEVQVGPPQVQRPETGRGSDVVMALRDGAAPDGIHGVLVARRPDGKEVAYDVELQAAAAKSEDAGASEKKGEISSPGGGSGEGEHGEIPPAYVQLGGGTADLSLPKALLFAFLGGLILNLMPCVLPAISLKIFGFVQQAGESRQKIFLFGLAFVAGIFAWFALMAALAVMLKLNGVDLNWGFMFQHPWLLIVMGAIVLAFALNLFGVFEVILPGQAANALSEASSKKGLSGTFMHGVFATVLATPCTAPYLGAALGFAFTQPVWVIPVIFAAIATGMGLPYLLLAIEPSWLSAMPKPGAWMERLKQFMGFLMLGVLVWIISLLAQRGPDAVTFSLTIFILVALLCWIVGAGLTPYASASARRWGWVGVAATVAAIVWVARSHGSVLESTLRKPALSAAPGVTPGLSAATPQEIVWQPFSAEFLTRTLDETNKPVFIDFTADWCWSCKWNERTILAQPEVLEAFQREGFALIKADWTDADPQITDMLKKFQRNGVPLYVLYPADRSRPAIVLPELITKGIVLQGIREAVGERSPR